MKNIPEDINWKKKVALSKQKKNWNLKYHTKKKSFFEMKNCRQFPRLFCQFLYIFFFEIHFLKNDLNIFYEIEFFPPLHVYMCACFVWMEYWRNLRKICHVLSKRRKISDLAMRWNLKKIWEEFWGLRSNYGIWIIFSRFFLMLKFFCLFNAY